MRFRRQSTWIGFFVAAIAAAMLLVGCGDAFDNLGGRGVTNSLPPAAGGDTVTIATFNIQVFGTSKSKDARVMDILAKTVRHFDVVAIQEVRSKDQSLIPEFVERINDDGAHYRHLIGPRQGRTSSKEQYAFIYNAATIEPINGSMRSVGASNDRLHRPPLVARFRVRGPPVNEAFTFTLINTHTDPDETKTEIPALRDVYNFVRRSDAGEDDVILLGDLNAKQKKIRKLGWPNSIHCVIKTRNTNTRETESYDNLLFAHATTAEYTGRFGVLNLKTEFDLTLKQALRVSDHMPVWAVFSSREK